MISKAMLALFAALAISLSAAVVLAGTDAGGTRANSVGAANTVSQAGYANVNGLEMYYEVHGEAVEGTRPLVLLHGAFMNIDLAFGKLIPPLTATRQVIALEFQAHGRTADIDRPISYEALADDTAALLQLLGVEKADVFGYSLGGGAALQVALRYPDLVGKLVVASASYSTAGLYPEVVAVAGNLTPELFAGSPIEEEYLRLAPRPDDWPSLIEKISGALEREVYEWPVQDIGAPALIILGDSDGVRPEHAVEMFRHVGGGVFGDLSGLPDSQLAILPGTMHITVLEQTDILLAIIPLFLDKPLRETTR